MWSFHRLEFRGPHLTYVPGTHKLLADPKTTGGYVLFFETSSYLLVGFHLCFPPWLPKWTWGQDVSKLLLMSFQQLFEYSRQLVSDSIMQKTYPKFKFDSFETYFLDSITEHFHCVFYSSFTRTFGENITFKLQSKFIKRISLPDLLRTKLLKTISSLSFAGGILTCSGKPSSI